jgi:virulence factor Mce-like protein
MRGGAFITSDRRLIALGALVLVVGALIAYASFTHTLPFLGAHRGRVVTAEVSAARQLTARTPVRADGVAVGHVESVHTLDSGRAAVVRLRLDHPVELHADAELTVRFRTLLGGTMEVSLSRGSSNAPPLGDRMIPLARTTVQTEVDDLTSVWRGTTAVAQREILAELAGGFAGRPAGVLVQRLAPAFTPLAPAAKAIRGHREDDLTALVRSTARVTSALGAEPTRLSTLVSAAQKTFSTTAHARAALAASLTRAPAALAAARRSAARVVELTPDVDRIVRELQRSAPLIVPTATALHPTLAALVRTLRTARPFLGQLRPAIDDVKASVPAGLRVVADLKPIVQRLDSDILPWLEHRGRLGVPVYQTVGPAISTVLAATAEYDKNGYSLHFPFSVSQDTLPINLNSLGVRNKSDCAKLGKDGRPQRCRALLGLLTRIFGATR